MNNKNIKQQNLREFKIIIKTVNNQNYKKKTFYDRRFAILRLYLC